MLYLLLLSCCCCLVVVDDDDHYPLVVVDDDGTCYNELTFDLSLGQDDPCYVSQAKTQ